MDLEMQSPYRVPTTLTVLAAIFLIIGAICAIIATVDIVWRKGWRSMMLIMIPVWIINATYMGPFTLFLYFHYGRPAHPSSGQSVTSCHTQVADKAKDEQPSRRTDKGFHSSSATSDDNVPADYCAHHAGEEKHNDDSAPKSSCCHNSSPISSADTQCVPTGRPSNPSSTASPDPEKQPIAAPTHSCHASSCSTSSRPMWATVASGVSHCGAGCVLGDLVGEWLVYGTSATIAQHSIWPCLLIDYAFALLFGILFQYFSIAPMSHQYGLKTVWRAVKADVLSLTSFEVGAFGWMVIYQVGIWGYRLDMMTWCYWWMMQVGMVMGFATAYPVNWWLLRRGIKEACC